MKLYIKSIIAMAALLLTTSAVAQGTDEKFVISYQNNGVDCNEGVAGTVVGSVSGTTATLTVTPVDGYYITKDQITVIKTIPGDNAQTRTPSVSSPVEITASSTTADPSGVTTYTFDASDANFNYEVTANFLSRISIKDAEVTVSGGPFVFTGEPIKPTLSITLGGKKLTLNTDYNAYDNDSIKAGVDKIITLVGIRKYTGTRTDIKYSIEKAEIAPVVSITGWTYGSSANEPTVTEGNPGNGEVTFAYKVKDASDETYVAEAPATAGDYTVRATIAETDNYKGGTATANFTIKKAQAELKYSTDKATATMGKEFTAPTLTVTPEGLEGITYSSSNTKAATIDENGIVTIVGAEETTIKASFAGNETYEAAEASYTLTVSKDKATLKFSAESAEAIMGKEFTAPTLTVTPEGLEGITYSSSNTKAATIDENGKVTIVGAEETTIKASFAGNETYEAAEASYTLTVSKDKATLKFSAETAEATMGKEFTAPTLTVTPEGLEGITYSSSNTKAATIDENGKVTIVGAEETTIKASFAGNETYEAAEASYKLTVSKDKATLKFSAETAEATMGKEFTAPTLTVTPEGLEGITYSSSNTKAATIDENGIVTIVGAEETTIKASFAGNETYEAAEASYKLTVSKDKATLKFSAETAEATMGKEFTAPTLTVTPEGLEGITYSSSNTKAATIDENGKVTIVGAEETTIKASFAGNETYEAAEASYKLTVSKDKATLKFSAETAEATMGKEFTAPTLTVTPEGLEGITYSSSNTKAATIDENGKVTIVGAEETTIKASFAGNETYEAAEASYKLTVSKDKATLKFSAESAEAIMGKEFTAPTLTVTPEGLEGITYSSSNTKAATIDENGKVTIVGAEETTIKASFAGNETYEAAEASYKLTVSKDKATLKFSAETAEATMGKEFTAPTLTVTPEGLEGITYSSSNTKAATIDENGKVTIVGAEETTITASFAGNETYEAAEASYKLTVSKDKATLKFSAETAEATMGKEFTAPTLTVTPEGLEGITYSSSNTKAATIDENGKVTIVGAEETTIKASFAGNETYEAAEASYKLTVSKDNATFAFSTDKATATMGKEFTAPTLNNPNSLAVTYTSSKETVATISAEGVVTIVGEGETVIKAAFKGNETYEAVEASYTLTVSKDKATLAFSAQTATTAIGATFTAPTLDNPNKLAVTYSSSIETVATINAEGVVTIVGEGETVIKATFAGNETYEPAEASYTLIVEKGVGQGYALWIGDTQVTEDNKEHILGDKDQTFTFNPDSKILLITNNQNKDIVIESRLDELTIYLNGNKGNKLKKVFFNNLGNAENKGKLVFTTNFNVPGSIDFKNDQGESVITGFESVEFDSKSQLTFTLPEKTTYEYKNGMMNKTVVDENNIETTTPADELSIGQSLTPIDEVVTFTLNTLYMKDENGNVIRDENGEPKLPNLVNSVVKDVLITLPGSNDANSDEGISVDDGDGKPGITIETVSMTDKKVKTIAQKVIDNQTTNTGYFPGSDDFAKDFVGMTILLPACSGSIETDLNTDPGYEFHALIAEEDNAGNLKSTIKVIPAGKIKTAFNIDMPSYCYIYLVQVSASTRLGKREKVHGKVYSVGVSVTKAKSVNPPSEASGGTLPASEDPNVNETTTPTPPTGITTVNSEQQTVKSGWYTLDGQKIAEPKQRGLYIKDGRKVVIK